MQTIISLAALAGLAASLSPAAIQFRHQQIEDELGIGYAVLCEDVDADGDTDIVALNETQVIWWSNPDWEKHVVLDGETEADNVAIAAYDITGDGKLEFAIGAAWRPSDTQGGGTLQVDRANGRPRCGVEVAPAGQRAHHAPHALGRC